MSRNSSFEFNKTSTRKINKFLDSLDSDDEEIKYFKETFYSIVSKEVKLLRECSEKSIVDFYIEVAQDLLDERKDLMEKEFYDTMKSRTRLKLSNKYVSNKQFDNNIDIYFNEVKREYILHPQEECDELEFIPENREIFIKNNLKLVIECAKRYRNLGLPFEDLIQIGNVGLLTAFDKFDSERANLQINIIKDINTCGLDKFIYDDCEELIKRNFKYTKTLDSTLQKIPEDGFGSKEEFVEWSKVNIKKPCFASIGFIWVRALIIYELNKYANIVRLPVSAKSNGAPPINTIRLDSINPHTDDCYHDNQISDLANEEFIVEDETIENIERQNLFKELIEKILTKLNVNDRRIIKKRFGIGFPFPLSITEIAESEGISSNRVKYIVTNGLKIIQRNIPEEDKKTIVEMLK